MNYIIHLPNIGHDVFIFNIYSANIYLNNTLYQELCQALMIVLSKSEWVFIWKRENKQVPKNKIILGCDGSVEEIKKVCDRYGEELLL